MSYAVCRMQKVKSAGLKGDRKSTRLNSSHVSISYAVFCLKKKKANDDRLKTLLQTDTFIARMGGDEFLLLKRNIKDKDAAIDYAEIIFADFDMWMFRVEYD